VLAERAAKCIDSSLAWNDYWPIDMVVNDASRFRKLLQLGSFYTIEGKRTLRFEPIDAAATDEPMTYEPAACASIDALPDRDRW
jgi:hypothetical protein